MSNSVKLGIHLLKINKIYFSLWRSFLSSIRDVLICGYQWMLVLVMLAVHTSLTFTLKVPGCPQGCCKLLFKFDTQINQYYMLSFTDIFFCSS